MIIHNMVRQQIERSRENQPRQPEAVAVEVECSEGTAFEDSFLATVLFTGIVGTLLFALGVSIIRAVEFIAAIF
jgi:hypothetical protein